MLSLLAISGAAISLFSAFIALLAYLITRRQLWANAIFQVVDRLESPEMRDIRYGVVYLYPRDAPDQWAPPGRTPEKTKFDLDRWGAEMDLLSLLFFSNQLSRVLFFEMYGDVIIRSAYKLAPYANRQRLIRGDQFWLPFQKLSFVLLQMWSKRAKKRKYPGKIGIPGSSDQLAPEVLKSDVEFHQFLQTSY